MDEQLAPQSLSTSQPIVEQPSRNWAKIFALSALGVLVSAGLVFAGYSMSPKITKTEPVIVNQATPTTNPSPSKNTQPSNTSSLADSGITIGPSTVSFARVANSIIMRYKGKIYGLKPIENSTELYIEEITVNEKDYSWIGLVNTSPLAQGNFDEVFDFRLFPNTASFVFIMRWDTSMPNDQLQQELYVYHYDATKTALDKVTQLLSFKPKSSNEGYDFPRINSLSDDGKYVAFNMFGCWNCGGHQPETMLMSIATKQTKRIGKTSFFAWKESGKYEYKEYKTIECTEPQPGECSIGQEKLPLLTGDF